MAEAATEPASNTIYDPVRRQRYTFRREGDDLIIDALFEPGGDIPEHFHPSQEERWSVLEGEADFKVAGKRRTLRPEDGALVVPPGTKHAVRNATDREAHLQAVASPALRLEELLVGLSEAAREGLYTRRGLPTSFSGAVQLVELLERFSDTVVVSSPPRFLQRLTFPLLLRFARRRS